MPAIAHTPADVDRLFAAALSAGDVEGALAMYAPDAVWVHSDGRIARGHDAIRTVITDLVALQPHLDCYEIDAEVADGGDSAMLRARWIFSGVSGGVAFENRGQSIEVVQRQPDGRWLFIVDLPNGSELASDTAAAAAPTTPD